MTKFTKKDQLSSSWYEIDAKNAVVGRLATVVSNIIRGKNKTTYTPHMDDGDLLLLKILNKQNLLEKNFKIKNITDTLVIQVELKLQHLRNFTKKNLEKL